MVLACTHDKHNVGLSHTTIVSTVQGKVRFYGRSLNNQSDRRQKCEPASTLALSVMMQ